MGSTSIGFSLALTSQDGSGDIQKSQFVCSILTVNPGAFNRIARIPEIYKMDTFYHSPVLHVQAGHDQNLAQYHQIPFLLLRC